MRLLLNEYFWTSPRGGPEVGGSSAATATVTTAKSEQPKAIIERTGNMDAALQWTATLRIRFPLTPAPSSAREEVRKIARRAVQREERRLALFPPRPLRERGWGEGNPVEGYPAAVLKIA
jgi:hypothetical protein